MSAGFKVGAPGKVILHGEHSVVYGKPALAVSVGLLTKLAITPISQDIQLQFPEVGINLTLTLESLKNLKNKIGSNFTYDILNSLDEIPIEPESKLHLSEYSAGVDFGPCDEGLKPAQRAAFESFLFVYLATFDSPVSFHFNIETELPVGAGLGSSASFAVALAGGLLLAANREPRIGFNLNTINRWAFVTEKFVHGTPSGVDNSVATFGGGIIFKKGEPLKYIKNCPDIHVILVNTKIPRSTKAMVDKVAQLQDNLTIFQEAMDAMESIVQNCVDEIEKNHAINPKLIAENQLLLSRIGVSHPSLDKIVSLSDGFGFKAKLTGAGGGGCAFIYIPPEETKESVASLVNALINDGYEIWDTILGCNGFRVIN